MVTLHTASLHRQAKDLLGRAEYSPKKLVLIHTAVSLGASLLMTVLNYLFSLQIADTGGLGGLGLRSMLTTAQSVMEMAVLAILPFWEFGLVYAALRWAKGETAGMTDLLQGFRRFGAVLGFQFFSCALFLALAIALFYFSTTVFMLTPWAAPLLELFAPIATPSATAEEIEALLTPELMQQAASTMTPLFILFSILFLVVAIPLFYRLRLSQFAVMEGTGAVKSMVQSIRITQRNSLQLLKLDLHFWWYYLLQVLCLAVSFGDVFLLQLGITLPVSADVGYFLFYVLGALCQLVLLWQAQAPLLTTYGLAYRAFKGTPPKAEIVPKPANVPWDV